MNKKHFIGVLIMVIIAAGVSGFLVLSTVSCDEVNSVDMSVVIETKTLSSIGINTDTDSLTFGKVSPSAIVERSIVVNTAEPADVSVYLQGDFSDWVSVDPSSFSLSEQEGKVVMFTVDVPEKAKAGSYSGKAFFCFKR